MAVFSAILVPAGEPAVKSTVTAASTAEIVLGNNRIFAINCDAPAAGNDCFIKFGNAGMGAAAITDFRIPANQTLTFDTGDAFTSIRVFGQGTSQNIYIQKLSRS